MHAKYFTRGNEKTLQETFIMSVFFLFLRYQDLFDTLKSTLYVEKNKITKMSLLSVFHIVM